MTQDRGGTKFHQATQDGMQFQAYELFIPGIFHLIFLDCGWPGATETVESETPDEGGELDCQLMTRADGGRVQKTGQSNC